ncbi:MAG: glycosyltransferase family 4 protein, partial [Chlamydiae bacterium]|nr:glycosyltransferase family 4 protein [Chlamydiota bacterium]
MGEEIRAHPVAFFFRSSKNFRANFMKILHLEASNGWGGQEIRILREAEGMRARGHEVIFGVVKGGKLVSHACKAGFTVHELNFQKRHWLVCLLRILFLIYCYNIDLINTHSSLDAWIGGIAGKIARRPIVRTRHLSTAIRPGWNSKLLYGKLADFVVTTCQSIVPVICQQSGKSRELCRSVPTGIDSSKLRVSQEEVIQMRLKWGVQKEDFLVGTACVFRSWKGIDDLLKAAGLLRDVPHLKWVLIGGGELLGSFQKVVSDLRLEGKVLFAGYLENPFPAISALDLFALLSTANEGVSQAILQAAFLEKPLVATTIGGLSEVCLNRITGTQVPPFSP